MKPILLLLAFVIALTNSSIIRKAGKAKATTVLSSKAMTDTARQPAVQLFETRIDSMCLVIIRDTARNAAELNARLGKAYGELYTFINENNLVPGKPMAFYYTSRWPFIFEAAVQTDKLAWRTKGRVKINRLPAGNAVVAKYKGPYGQISIAYTAITGWLAAHHKTPVGYPFEVYISDPQLVKDTFELRTDVYQLLKE